MRITNKIMQNNSMYNINNNKITEDDYSTQMATGKKISRPSDDPVIAIRALRLRSTVTQLDQYYEKNSKDAESWLQVTEDALTTISDVLTDAKKLSNQGANKDLTIDDLNTIVTQLEELSNEYYATGNVDFANRYIFTGYRTNTPLSFDGKTTVNFIDINDEFNASDIGTSRRVVNLQDLSAETVLQATGATTELDVQEYEVGRLRLSYDNLDYDEKVENTATLNFRENLTQPATSTISNTELKVVNLTFQSGDGIVHKAYIPVTETDTATPPNITSDNTYSITVDNTTSSITYTAEAHYEKKNDKTELTGYTVKAVETMFDGMTPPTTKDYQFELTKDGVIDIDTDTESPTYGEIVLERYKVGDVKDGVVTTETSSWYDTPKKFLNQDYADMLIAYAKNPATAPEPDKSKRVVIEGITTTTLDNREATAAFSDNYGNTEFTIPLLKSQDQQYRINITDSKSNGENFSVTVNSDGTFTVTNQPQKDGGTLKYDDDPTNGTGAEQTTVINMTENGSIRSSYTENAITIDKDHIIYRTTAQGNTEDKSTREEELDDAEPFSVDKAYQILEHNKDKLDATLDDQKDGVLFLNADTGEIIMSQALKDRLSSLKAVINANTIDAVYDKREWEQGDIQPQHLFSCKYVGSDGEDSILKADGTKIKDEDILYNGGFRGHDIEYDVGYNQRVTVNTTADTVFTADVKRDVADLSNIMDQLNQVNTVMKTLKQKLSETTDNDQKTTIQNEIDAAQKAYDYLRTDLQKEFEKKISSMSEALDAANVAVTQNGTRSRRLELIQTRLQNQTTTFKTLQSSNEDIDIAETATNLTTAQTTYQASLIATGKISKTSLMDYI